MQKHIYPTRKHETTLSENFDNIGCSGSWLMLFLCHVAPASHVKICTETSTEKLRDKQTNSCHLKGSEISENILGKVHLCYGKSSHILLCKKAAKQLKINVTNLLLLL